MQRPLSIAIGLRFTQSKRRNKFLSFIALISMGGLVLGVTALIVITSVLNGFEEALTTRILGMIPQAAVYSAKPIENWESLSTEIKANDTNVLAVAPFVRTRGMVSANGEVHATIINGIDPVSQPKVSIVKDSMVSGSLDSLSQGSYNIVLGQTLTDELNLKLGDKIRLLVAEPSSTTPGGMIPRLKTFTLSGIFHVSNETDSWLSYVSMNDAADVLNVPHGIYGLRLKLKSVFDAPNSAEQASKIVTKALYPADPLSLEAQENISPGNWKETHSSLYGSIRMQKTLMSFLLFLIILVAAFNIVSSLIMMVTEKKSDIAILKTIGATSSFIVRIFMVQGMVIGLLGTLLGVILGVSITLNIEEMSRWVNTTFELGLFDNYFVETLPAKLQILDIFLIILSSILVSFLATIYPSKKAAQIEPAKALRYD